MARLNLTLRAFMEAGVVIGLAWWGYDAGTAAWSRLALAVAAPTVGFGIWGTVDFRRAGRWAEPLRLIEELVISAVAAVAWYIAGQHALGVALAAVSVVYHVLVYTSGSRLLEGAQQPAEG
jgi:hypothetical protein